MSGAIGNALLLVRDAASILSIFGPPQWGLFDQYGNPLLAVDSVADIDYSRDYDLSYYPQEQGAFENYNKVQKPYQAKLGFFINQSRFVFLQSIEAIAASLEPVVVLTPEIVYASANVTHYGYRRESRHGVSLIRVEVWVEEVRVTAGTVLGQSAAQSTGGTTYPVGQVNNNALSGSTNGPALPTKSTNAATPSSAGQLSPVKPGATNPANPATTMPPLLTMPF